MTVEEQTEVKLSKVEEIKLASNGLAGTIREVCESEATHFEEGDFQLLKFHGSYQQDDRDQRSERRKQKLDKAWMFMIRAKIPAGRLTAEQYLAMDTIADRFANGSIRVTSRQGIQFHGVGKQDFKGLVNTITDVKLSTLGGCGDVNRNVMCATCCDLDWREPLGMHELAARLAEHFAPRSTAYWEIWCDGVKWGEPVVPTREEPIYGKTYLPRKFKMGVASPEDNGIDLYTQDIGFEAVHEQGRLLAWDLIVGGGMGYSHGQTQTFPRIGTRLVRCNPGEVLEVAEQIVLIQRDFGGRAERRHARLKYLMEDRGTEWFRQELFSRLGRELPEAGPIPSYQVEDHLGWHRANDGSWFVGIHIPNGRILDHSGWSAKRGIKKIVERYRTEVRLTPRQDVVLVGISDSDKAAVQAELDAHHLSTDANLPMLRRLAMACVALPTCGLALAESERYMPTLLDQLEALGVADAPVEIRMTGCPNSCVRSPMAELGIVGRGPGKYAVYLGGSQGGTRLAWQFDEKVEETQLPELVRDLIVAWREATNQSVSFGDWAWTEGPENIAGRLAKN